jgi:flagellin FlaB
MKRLLSREEAFTGLEAAIVLIAFVVVAAVFSYVVLGAGFFSTQKAQESVHTGVQQASSSFEILGDVYGVDPDEDKAQITYLNFTVGLAPGGMPIDMSKVTMVFANQSVRKEIGRPLAPAPLVGNDNPGYNNWSIARVVNSNGLANALLETGEQMEIVVSLEPSNYAIAPRDAFTLEIKPIIGPSLAISRNAPGGIDKVNKLY